MGVPALLGDLKAREVPIEASSRRLKTKTER